MRVGLDRIRHARLFGVCLISIVLASLFGGIVHADPAQYVALQLRAIPDQNSDSTFVASLAITNMTGVDIPAGTPVTFSFTGLTFNPKTATSGSLSGGATWKRLTTGKGTAALDNTLASGATLNVSLSLPLTAAPNPGTLGVRAALPAKIGRKSITFSSNRISSTTDDGSVQALLITSPKNPGPKAKAHIKAGFFAGYEPIAVNITPAIPGAPTTVAASRTGSVSLDLTGVTETAYSVTLSGLWDQITGKGNINVIVVPVCGHIDPKSTLTFSGGYSFHGSNAWSNSNVDFSGKVNHYSNLTVTLKPVKDDPYVWQGGGIINPVNGPVTFDDTLDFTYFDGEKNVTSTATINQAALNGVLSDVQLAINPKTCQYDLTFYANVDYTYSDPDAGSHSAYGVDFIYLPNQTLGQTAQIIGQANPGVYPNIMDFEETHQDGGMGLSPESAHFIEDTNSDDTTQLGYASVNWTITPVVK